MKNEENTETSRPMPCASRLFSQTRIRSLKLAPLKLETPFLFLPWLIFPRHGCDYNTWLD